MRTAVTRVEPHAVCAAASFRPQTQNRGAALTDGHAVPHRDLVARRVDELMALAQVVLHGALIVYPGDHAVELRAEGCGAAAQRGVSPRQEGIAGALRGVSPRQEGVAGALRGVVKTLRRGPYRRAS